MRVAKWGRRRTFAPHVMLTVIAAAAAKQPIQADVAEPYLWVVVVAALAGLAIGYAAIWILLRQTRRLAKEKAESHIELAKREAAVAAQEIVSKAEEEIRNREAEFNRDFDRRKIETEMMLREIRSHEESLGLLDYQLEQRQDRGHGGEPPGLHALEEREPQRPPAGLAPEPDLEGPPVEPHLAARRQAVPERVQAHGQVAPSPPPFRQRP